MIPDKIYVREYPVGLNQEWDEKPMVKTVAIAQHEYIRKDALIEWTNKMLQDTADRLDFHGNRAFTELYSKLNSM